MLLPSKQLDPVGLAPVAHPFVGLGQRIQLPQLPQPIPLRQMTHQTMKEYVIQKIAIVDRSSPAYF